MYLFYNECLIYRSSFSPKEIQSHKIYNVEYFSFISLVDIILLKSFETSITNSSIIAILVSIYLTIN